jgi:adenosylcobinamide kinase / adenosylcobinamide-phosphate guanylyltransferase
MLTLVIGGARSGKSRFAQSLCPSAEQVAYVATARTDDDKEMRQRIARHRQSRPPHWLTVEEPLELANAVRQAFSGAGAVLIDCLTVWLGNLLWELREWGPDEIEENALSQIDRLAELAAGREVIVVSNEVGNGIVPETPVGRIFRDLQGLVNQRCAARADRVFLVVAGIAIPIKRPQEAP